MKPKKTNTPTPADDSIRSGRSAPPAAAENPVPATDTEIALAAIADAVTHIGQIIGDLQNKLEIGMIMTGRERQRLNGARAKNYGFITQAAEIARAHPRYLPYHFSLDDVTTDLRLLEQAKQLTLVLEQLRTLADDFQLRKSDSLYRNALWVYHSLQQQARGRVPGAEDLVEQLSPYFKGRGRGGSKDKPTGDDVRKRRKRGAEIKVKEEE